MLPQAVLHKRNGNRQVPQTPALSPGDVLRMIHSEPDGSAKSSYDLLRFAQAAQREKESVLLDQVTQGIDAMRTSLADVLVQTQDGLERGEDPDVRALLRAIETQADIALRIVSRLAEAARPRAGERHPINADQLALEALARVAPGLRARVTLSTRIAPELPPLRGDAPLLVEALVALIVHAGAGIGAGEAGGTINMEVARGEACEGGARVVIRVSGQASDVARSAPESSPWPEVGADPAAGRRSLERARRIVLDHGGALATEQQAGGIFFAVELPAA